MRKMAPINATRDPLGKGKVDTRAVYYRGPCAPVVHGNTLTFVRTNWVPRIGDDIRVAFGLGKG